MKLSLDDKMFFMVVLGTIILAALVFTGKADAETLIAWLGGSGTASAGRLFKRGEEP